MFPREDEVTYIGENFKRGKLVEKYYNLSKKYRNVGIINSKYKRKRSTDSESTSNSINEESEDILEKVSGDKEWLRYNQSPIEIVEKKWKNTFGIRRKDILNGNVDVYVNWPILNQNIAVTLFELDFNWTIHIGCAKLFYILFNR
ncbi:uncharacterized protein [Onthophagus taurus]|uniref:uncharacterized protein n=1 Tax=Onthophagus taurus TaxID=166361 RepID=UPI0039BE65D2